MKYVIGITGGIASGKTTFLNFLKDRYSIIDTDLIAHQVLQQENIKIKLIKIFGSKIITNNQINRFELGKIVFDQKEKLAILESIVHPLIIREMNKQIKKLDGIILVAVPLLFEKKLEKYFDEIVVVYTSLAKQIEFLMNRSNLTKTEATVRINSQLSLEVKKKLATRLILNTGSLDHLEQLALQCAAKWDLLVEKVN